MAIQVGQRMFVGGENLITAQELVDERTFSLCENYDPVLTGGGFRRIAGYERFNGKPAPSSFDTPEEKDSVRDLISPVPGTGPVRGVVVFKGDVYAFRNENSNNNCIMYRAESDGWSQVVGGVFPPGGRYEFRIFNFYANTDALSLYGVSGAAPAFEFDGTDFTTITTGMPVDTPTHLACHNMSLWLTFPGGSLQHSAPGDPTNFSALWNAGEIGIGDEITALRSMQSNGVLVVFGETRTARLEGRIRSEYRLVPHNDDVGALPFSVQSLGETYFVDRLGVTSLRQTEYSGDMLQALLSQTVDPYVKGIRATGDVLTVDVRTKNLYRVMTYNTTPTQVSTMLVGTPEMYAFTRATLPVALTCVDRGYIDNKERVFAGGADGYVYEMESGDRFDNQEIPSYIRTQAMHFGSPHMRKHWRHIWLNCQATQRLDITFSAQYDYADPETPSHTILQDGIAGSGGVWNRSNWNQFQWSGRPTYPLVADLEGTSGNISLAILASSKDIEPHTIYGIRSHYTPRRLIR